MIQRLPTLVEQLYQVEGKAEIVDGEIVLMSPASFRHGRRAGVIYRSLAQNEDDFGGGCAFPDNVGFLVDLPNRKSFSPDAGWVTGDIDEDDPKFLEVAPTFAVEVRSKRAYGVAGEKALAAKISDYFAAGTLVVWDVNLLSDDVITSHLSDGTVKVFRFGDVADAEPAVLGWRFPVDKLKPRRKS